MAARATEAVPRRGAAAAAAPAAPAAQQRELALAPPPPPKASKPGGSLIEFSTIAGEDPNENVTFTDVPASCKCPHCERSVVTFIDYEASWVTWLLAFVVWVSLGWMAFWVLPLLWPAFKDVVHHCPRCLNVIQRKSRISLPTFRTEVMTCKVGGCAVVLARKYVAILLGLVGIIATVYCLRSTVQMHMAHEEHKGAPSMLTWEDFLFDCGPRTSLSHRPSTARAFEERFRRRTFKWQGEVRIIREGFDVFFVRTKSVALVQMYPPRYPHRRGEHPDIALLFGEEQNREVAELSPGDWVEFEATMTAHGFRGDPELMILWHVAKAQRPDPPLSSPGAGHHPGLEDEEAGGGKAAEEGGGGKGIDTAEGSKVAEAGGGGKAAEGSAAAEGSHAAAGSNAAESSHAAAGSSAAEGSTAAGSNAAGGSSAAGSTAAEGSNAAEGSSAAGAAGGAGEEGGGGQAAAPAKEGAAAAAPATASAEAELLP